MCVKIWILNKSGIILLDPLAEVRVGQKIYYNDKLLTITDVTDEDITAV